MSHLRSWSVSSTRGSSMSCFRSSRSRMADAWWGSQLRPRRDADDDDPDWWAVDLWLAGGPIWGHEDLLQRGIAVLAERMPPGADIGSLGAGPIENVITNNEDRLHWIEAEAARSPRFRAALANVWIEELGAATFLRVQHSAGVDLVWHV